MGITPAPIETIKGGDVRENAEILKTVLQGKGTPQQQDVVALNAALALYVGEAVSDKGDCFTTFSDAVMLAKDAMNSGEPWRKFEELVEFLG